MMQSFDISQYDPSLHKCLTCRFCLCRKATNPPFLVCRRNAPQRGLAASDSIGQWPTVARNWTCGEYKPASEEDLQERADGGFFK